MTHDKLVELLQKQGFTPKTDKGDGVLQCFVTNKLGEDMELVALVSAKDSSLLIYKPEQVVPVKIKFGRNYKGALEFITDYTGALTLDNSQGVNNHVSNSIQ